eukprot:5341173-Pyramimonas_sp.AAC.1
MAAAFICRIGNLPFFLGAHPNRANLAKQNAQSSTSNLSSVLGGIRRKASPRRPKGHPANQAKGP